MINSIPDTSIICSQPISRPSVPSVPTGQQELIPTSDAEVGLPAVQEDAVSISNPEETPQSSVQAPKAEESKEEEPVKKESKLKGIVKKDTVLEFTKDVAKKLIEEPCEELSSAISFGYYAYKTIRSTAKLAGGVKAENTAAQATETLGVMGGICNIAGMIIPGFGTAGTAIGGSKRELAKAIKNGDITPEQAEFAVNNTVGAPVAGAVKLGKWASHTWETRQKPSGIEKLGARSTASSDAVSSAESKPSAEPKPSTDAKPAKEKATLRQSGKAFAISIGGAVGAVGGSISGAAVGAIAGAAIGGPIGGIVGAVVGKIAGRAVVETIGGRIGRAVGNAIERHEAQNKPTPELIEERTGADKHIQ